jgi:hypothetical protein
MIYFTFCKRGSCHSVYRNSEFCYHNLFYKCGSPWLYGM